MKLTYYDTSHHNVAILLFHGCDLASLITFQGTILYQAVSGFSGEKKLQWYFKVLGIYIWRM